MTTEQLAVLRALVAAHPGGYTLSPAEHPPWGWTYRWLRDGDCIRLANISMDGLGDVDDLCTLANAVPDLLTHIARLEARHP
jgi:hypothetical protein